MSSSFGRSSIIFGAAVIGSNLAQVAWLIAGARAFPGSDFGTVLTAQAMYGLLQVVVDNGTGFLGARIAARDELTDARRQEIVRARVTLALACAALGVAIASMGGVSLLRAFAPFCVALLLISVLNVWEDYGRGRVLPYASYLLLRSLVLGVVVGAIALGGSTAPVELAGLCEVGALVLVGTVFFAWTSPRRHATVPGAVWSSIRDIGMPAVLTQYGFAVSTILLGVSGRTHAAATCAVAFRLLTGIQAINGALGAAVFPILARSDAGDDHARAGRRAAYGMVGLAVAGLAVVAALSGVLAEAFLAESGDAERAALILGAGAAGGAALVMHRNFSLVASGSETEFRRASVRGALLVTLAAVAAAAVGGRWSPLVALAGYAIAQVVVLMLVARAASGPRGMPLLVFAAGVLPLTAVAIAVAVAA